MNRKALLRPETPVIAVLLVGLLTVGASASADGIYRWIDGDGTVHYGLNPPPDVDARRVNIEASGGTRQTSEPTPAAADEAATGSETPVEEEPADESGATPPPLSDAACERLEDNLSMLETNPAGVLVPDEEGEVRRLPADEREQRMSDIREELDIRCDS